MIKFIDDISLSHKRILLRVDFNVSLNPNFTIADDTRIRQGLPTIEYLLKHQNRIILVTHLGRPHGHEEKYSLKKVAKDLKHYLPKHKIILINDFLTAKEQFTKQTPEEILLLENIRFYAGEDTNDHDFAQKLASLAEVYVNDAFSVDHREAASVVGVTDFLPSYGGLLLKKEITMLDQVIKNPKKPLVTVMGGSKISTKLKLIDRLIELSDVVLLGGGIANNFLLARGLTIGKSIIEKQEMLHTKHLLAHARAHGTKLLLPVDVVVSTKATATAGTVRPVTEIKPDEAIFDIGPHTQAEFGTEIAKAKTILWNGPVGYFENPAFKRGTDYLYYVITENREATSIVGGGETLAALSQKEHLEVISHVSTGGGAMLEYIQNGTLVGIEALKKAK